MKNFEPNERLRTFKVSIEEVLKASKGPVSRDDLRAAIAQRHPELCDDSEKCTRPACPNVGEHGVWNHNFDRAIYDLTQTKPRKLVSAGRGWYQRA